MANFKWNLDEFRRIRNSPGWVEYLEKMGSESVERLNTELRAAQAKRKEPVEDGYTHFLTSTASATRLHIGAETARAQVHEDRHSSVLKLINKPAHVQAEDWPRVYAERANENKQRAAGFMSHVKAFTNA